MTERVEGNVDPSGSGDGIIERLLDGCKIVGIDLYGFGHAAILSDLACGGFQRCAGAPRQKYPCAFPCKSARDSTTNISRATIDNCILICKQHVLPPGKAQV